MTGDLPIEQPASIFTAMPTDTNPDGDIFGGVLLAKMDLAAGGVASRRANGRVVTVAVDAMQFLSPVFVGDEVSIYANIAKIGNTSLGVHVVAYARRQYTEDFDKVTEATFTFVKLGPDRKPRPLPT